ncbi:UDP-glucose iridoid glucosyltransferase-like isoform X2 [Tripterygium wilfordii]|uniref:UDP-glucose iridoid glucosyltransferase-like isoform X2 n=1 Tax=Tripterygium wilfordii TaxID=458696 RepID=A0A7J7DNJ6_TRIWF|nr:UDP-glycosyltransferase 76C4-like [Tripterygium wilfordii]KAF5747935.1 UDP-glucose iridoid glucosyltransferase-like isoform X2 [Tripterygium wilfordii]
MENKGIRRTGGPHLVLVPCPLQGHMNPMLHLAKLLHSKGFTITIINTQISSHHHHHPNDLFFYESIDGGLPDASSIDGDVVPFLLELNLKCREPFRDCLARMMVRVDGSRDHVSCIIHDSAMYFSVSVADELEIPRIVLRTSSAATFYGFSLLFKRKGCLPIQEDQMEEALEEFPTLRVKDMPIFKTSYQEAKEEIFATTIHNSTMTASAIIWNSLTCLEQLMFKNIQENHLVPIFPIGPLHKHSKASLTTKPILTKEDHHPCIVWLDTQTPKSVIYVSLGSLVAISENEFIEMGWGLANSDQPILWVVRPGLVHGSNGSNLVDLFPKELNELMSKRACKFTDWAPQEQVLAHPSIGGFLTHNGWNSTIESICEGVPMICWPCFGDQRVNARFVSHFWRVGVQLEDKLEREDIESAIRRLMVDKEGKKIRGRAIQFKEKIGFSLRQGGSSCVFLDNLVDFIKTKSNPF